LMYWNFFHWNLSKVLIFFYSILLWALSIIPLIGVFFAYSYFSDVNISMLLDWLYTGKLLNNFFWNAILLLILFVCFIFYSYWNVLLINIYNSYFEKKNLPYKNSEYFNLNKICKYFNLTIFNILILLVPFILFFILVGILLLFSGGLNNVLKLVSWSFLNYFSILSFIFLIISSILLIYLFYRTIFSYFVFTDKNYFNAKTSVFTYIKESFSKTKKIKNFFKFCTILIIFVIITIPVKIVSVALKNNVKILTDYTLYKKLDTEKKDYVSSTDPYYYQWLEIEFKWFTDVDLAKKLNLNEIYVLLFSILNFLFINWLFVMVYSSFYRREL
jgi:hypothetical protein